jgi:hypothetical protein
MMPIHQSYFDIVRRLILQYGADLPVRAGEKMTGTKKKTPEWCRCLVFMAFAWLAPSHA